MHVHILTKMWDQKNHDWDTPSATHRHPPIFVCNYADGSSRYWKSCTLAYMYWYMYTFYPRCGTRRSMTGTDTATQGHPYFPLTMQRQWEQTCGVRCTYIQVLMHVHIIMKVLGQEKGNWDTYSAMHGHPCLHITMQRSQTDIGSQVHMHNCTDACTHSN